MFEPLSRKYSATVGWETAVRVRHLASGRYLAVDIDPDNVVRKAS